MALEAGETLLEDWLGLDNSSGTTESAHFGDCDGPGPGDEFFHSREEYGVSELAGCKWILYATIGSSSERVWDAFFLFPALLFIGLLAFSSPRTRQQLAGTVSPLLSALHLLLILAAGASLLRSLLQLALPPRPHSAGVRDKVGWVLARGCGLALELAGVVLLSLSSPPAAHTARRAAGLLAATAVSWAAFTLALEVAAPAKEFYVYATCTALYGEGGGLYTALTALLLTGVYFGLLGLHACRPRARPPALAYTATLALIQATRALGGLLLYHDLALGLCLTNLTLFLLVAVVPPLAWRCLLRPLLGSPMTGLLPPAPATGYRPHTDFGLEDGGLGEDSML